MAGNKNTKTAKVSEAPKKSGNRILKFAIALGLSNPSACLVVKGKKAYYLGAKSAEKVANGKIGAEVITGLWVSYDQYCKNNGLELVEQFVEA